jgi:N-acetylglutamate synthase-like GNAT family acetyltransferase
VRRVRGANQIVVSLGIDHMHANHPATDQINIRDAASADIEDISRLVNDAFRPERFFIDGDRTSPEKITALFQKGRFLLAEEAGRLLGCVYIELRGERGYFGLLSVDPTRQRDGLGSRLIALAENDCRNAGCRFMDLTMVNLRTELYGYYRKRGYTEDGTLPFPKEQHPPKVPCHLVKMSKPLR